MPAVAQLGPVPLAGLAVKPQGAAVARPLAQKLSDQLSLPDFGAACDGKTDDSAAVVSAAQSGSHVTVPSGLVCNAPSISQAGMTGAFVGGGQIRGSDGNLRGPQWSAVRLAPNPQAWNQPASTQDGCSGGLTCWAKFDYSHTLSAEEYHISGAATLGQPAHGYEGMPGSGAHYLFIDNGAGWNQSHLGNDGRTGASAYNVVLQQNGAGDFGVFNAQILCAGSTGPGDGGSTASGNVRGYTDWLAVPGCGYQGGNISALTNGQYLQMQEFHVSDNGNDVSAIGSVMGYSRTSTTAPGLNNRWIDQLTTCNLLRSANAIPCDAAYVVGGQWYIGLDFVGLPGVQAVTAPVAMMSGQKIALNGSTSDGEGNPSATNLGGDWITDDGSGIVFAQTNSTALRLYNPPNSVNYWQFSGSTSGNAVAVGANGSDATIPVLLSDKGGAGVITLSNNAIAMRVVAPSGASGYLNVAAGSASSPLLLQDYALGNQDFAIGAAGAGLVRVAGTVPGATDSSTAVATTAFVKAAVGAAIGNRYKIANVGSGALLTIPVPSGVVDAMIVEIVPNQATIATMQLTMPATAAIPDGFIVHFIATNTITNFTLTGNSGQTVLGGPGTITPTSPVAFMWDNGLSEWIPIR